MVVACSSRPAYTPFEGDYGYSDARLDSNIQVSRFVGAPGTPPKYAELFSHFRAIELCLERGKQFARFWGTTDRTLYKTVQRPAMATFRSPSYFMGPYASYTGLWGAPYAEGRLGNSGRWTDTYAYPSYDTAFTCGNSSYGLGLSVRPVFKEEMRAYVKDGGEGVAVEALLFSSANHGILHVGDIIVKVGETRIQTMAQLGTAVDAANPKDKIALTIVRGKGLFTVRAKAAETTAEDRARNGAILSEACKLSETKHRLLCASRHYNTPAPVAAPTETKSPAPVPAPSGSPSPTEPTPPSAPQSEQ